MVKLLQFAKLGGHSGIVIRFRKDYTCRTSTWPWDEAGRVLFLSSSCLKSFARAIYEQVSFRSTIISHAHLVFLSFCRTSTKMSLITSQTRVKRVSRIHHRTICTLIQNLEDGPVVYPANAFDSYLRGDKVPLGSSKTISQKRLFGLAARNCLAVPLPRSFSSSSYFFSFSK